MNLTFDKEQHKYFLDGKEIPSATQIVSAVLNVRLPDNVFVRRATEVGTLIHSQIEGLIKKGTVDFPTPETENFEKITKKHKYVWTMSEQMIYNEVNGYAYAGTLDLYDATHSVLADIKTGSTKALKKWQLQLSLYAWALIDQLQLEVKKLVVIWVHGTESEHIELELLPKEEIVKVLEQYYNPTNEIVVLDSCDLTVGEKLKLAFQTIARIKEEIKSYEDKILQEMEGKGIKKYSDNNITISYVEPTKRKSIDTKKLKEEKPSIYEKYLKETEVKSSIRISIKE